MKSLYWDSPQAPTRAQIKPGQGRECKINQSAWFSNLSAYSWKIPFTVLIAPEYFLVFRCLWEGANFPCWDFDADQNFDVEMNFMTPWTDHLHCHTNDSGGFSMVDSFTNVWETFLKACGQCQRHRVLIMIQHQINWEAVRNGNYILCLLWLPYFLVGKNCYQLCVDFVMITWTNGDTFTV